MALTDVNLFRIDGTVGFTSNLQTSALNGGPLAGSRNRIINGDMRIDQRATSVTANATANYYTVDRWRVRGEGADGVFTAAQSSTAPTGFNNSLLITVTTADASIGATQVYGINQLIEGYNVADLGWGTASAKTVTLSFWVRSSLTGTFSGALRNNDDNRAYPFTYAISAANTFEYKTVTIPGDTSGTWGSTNDIGLWANWSLGVGADRKGTAGAWASGALLGATGETAVISTNGATFYITGVQLEPGTVATPFERRSYGQELALCQRYFEVFGPMTMMFPWASGTQIVRSHSSFAVRKRAAPTITMGSKTSGSGSAAASDVDTTGTAFAGTGSIQDVLIYTNNIASAEL
jgi:hypothetical protein